MSNPSAAGYPGGFRRAFWWWRSLAGGKADGRRLSWARRALAEPLFQFFLVGGALFAAVHLFGAAAGGGDSTIVVDDAVVARQGDLYRVQTGVDPDPQKVAALISQYVRDEALYREAMRLGLLSGDEIIRRRLIQKISFIAGETPREPSDPQLKAFYRENQALFTAPATRSFRHLYFSADQDEAAGRRRAEATRAALLRGADEDGLGEAFALQQSYTALNTESATQIFGDTPFVQALFSSPAGRWEGPFRSGYGWHLVRVDRDEPARLKPFETVRQDVHDAFMEEAARNAKAEHLAKILDSYDVVVRYKGGPVAQDKSTSITRELDD